MHQRVFAIGSFGDMQFAIMLGDPAPTRTKLCEARLHEISAHLVVAAEISINRLHESRWDFLAAAIGLHPIPEMHVVIMLANIVDEALSLISISHFANIFD